MTEAQTDTQTDTPATTDTTTANYEAMFLISQGAATDLAGVVDHINHLFERAGATLIAMSKWDERRLAYEIDKQKRGVYLLVYFNAPRVAIQGFERDCNLSETLMRVLVLRADHLSIDEMKATDGREELVTEAKLRADKAAKATEKDESVSIGAPEAERAAQAAAAAAAAAEAAAKAAEAAAKKAAESAPEPSADAPAPSPAPSSAPAEPASEPASESSPESSPEA